MKLNLQTVPLVLVPILPTIAMAFEAPNGMAVNPVDDSVFEVVARDDVSGDAFWCAAGMYAEIKQKKRPGEKMSIARGLGPSETTDRLSAVQFTTDPVTAGVTPKSMGNDINEYNVGETLEIGIARGHCLDH
ncbi:hypothetical protein [Ruegeria hyattellae]|uniref:hypothetical protein n=1 Tax=Ruegeria hyattellae TaxID=3233337 RepID=UPI00355B49A7